jgi:nucleoside-diphosphate-sugar epimerase
MIESARLNDVKRFFFSSSACIYPEVRQMLDTIPDLKESDADGFPDTYYGWEKLMMEQTMRAYHEDFGMDIRIARYHNVFGPFKHSAERDKAPAAFCKKVIKAKDNGEIEMWGDGTAVRSFLYIDDCVAGTLALMESNYDKPLNIGSNRAITMNALLDIAIRISGKKNLTINHIEGPLGVRNRNADISLAKEVLGWQPQVELEQGMRKLYHYLLEGE